MARIQGVWRCTPGVPKPFPLVDEGFDKLRVELQESLVHFVSCSPKPNFVEFNAETVVGCASYKHAVFHSYQVDLKTSTNMGKFSIIDVDLRNETWSQNNIVYLT